jgi:hypothetical protein
MQKSGPAGSRLVLRDLVEYREAGPAGFLLVLRDFDLLGTLVLGTGFFLVLGTLSTC